jgi:hypothetical protein
MATKTDTRSLGKQGREEAKSTPEYEALREEESKDKFALEDLNKMVSDESSDAFDNFEGESLGLNILNLEVGESDGPFTVKSIVPTEFRQGKQVNTIKVYTCLKGTTEVRMPISASFVDKADKYPFKIGTVFVIKRTKNFQAKDYGTSCKAYLIKVKK